MHFETLSLVFLCALFAAQNAFSQRNVPLLLLPTTVAARGGDIEGRVEARLPRDPRHVLPRVDPNPGPESVRLEPRNEGVDCVHELNFPNFAQISTDVGSVLRVF